jgi:glycosyltransferase involved in cell wall biosynthesis
MGMLVSVAKQRRERKQMRRLKILYHHRIKSRDGQFIHIRSLIRAFRRAGHDVVEVGLTAGESGTIGEESPFWKTFLAILPRWITELLQYLYSLPAALWLWLKILRFKPDLVYERYALGNFAGILAARWAKIPLFLEVNSPLAEEKRAYDSLRFISLARNSERRILRGATRILVVSRVLKEICMAQGIDEERIVVIPNGIDPEHYNCGNGEEIRRRYGLQDDLVIGFVGFFRRWHRLEMVLKILAEELADLKLKLMLVGDGPVRQELEEKVRNLSIEDRVAWIGVLEHERVPMALAAMDMALQCEGTEYASPLKLFEYMAAGLPIVAPRMSNIQEVLQDGETGLLYTPEDPKALASALRRMAEDPELRERLGKAARDHLLAGGFTWDENADRILKMLGEI